MKRLLAPLVLLVAVALAYLPSLRNGFVWDDTALVLRDPLIRSWRLIPEGFTHFLFTDATPSDFYRPIQRLTYTLEYWAVAARPAGYHLTSVLCHFAAACGLWVLARELLRRYATQAAKADVIALIAALLWAVHPAHSAAVSYVAGRADPLAAAFGFFGLFFALRSDAAGRGARWRYWAAATIAFVCGALSKESGLIFPALWALLLLIERRWQTLGRWAGAVAIVLSLYLSLRLSAEHQRAPILHQPAPWTVRPILVFRAAAEYTALLGFPRHLYMERDVETHPSGASEATFNAAAARELETLAGIIILAALVYWGVRARKNNRASFVCLVLAGATYLPISGIVPLNATVAEHWIYVPSAFLLVAVVAALARVVASRSALRPIGLACVAAIIIALAARTWFRNLDWRDERTFFARTIASGGDSPRMLVNLAIVEMNEGQLASAHAHLNQALAKDPAQPFVLLSLASLAIREKNFKAAGGWLDRATKDPFAEPQARELQVVLINHETGQSDLMRMRLAARTGPPNWSIEKRYIRLLAESGALPAAIKELQGILVQDWYRAESWELMGELLEKTGDGAAAGRAFARASELDVHLALRPRIL